MDSIHTVAGDVQVSVNAAVNVMSQLLNKMNDLNEEMKPVTEIAAQIRDISNTLKLLENGTLLACCFFFFCFFLLYFKLSQNC